MELLLKRGKYKEVINLRGDFSMLKIGIKKVSIITVISLIIFGSIAVNQSNSEVKVSVNNEYAKKRQLVRESIKESIKEFVTNRPDKVEHGIFDNAAKAELKKEIKLALKQVCNNEKVIEEENILQPISIQTLRNGIKAAIKDTKDDEFSLNLFQQFFTKEFKKAMEESKLKIKIKEV